eukprot:TRINITY_DN10504_c0_g1_i2.p1 TRINITY_DN10504_c0_g1~~TRINITY_DN10504_c0_g1_i2.p1  ORF type:complete len:224 (+),score=35.91 TRINITY_DN10504_c0_g1_i2:459-1130(+)
MEPKYLSMLRSTAEGNYKMIKSRDINIFNSTGVIVNSLKPDGGIVPLGRAPPAHNIYVRGGSQTPWPSVVFEIAVSRTLTEELNKAIIWLSANTEVQMVIIVKIWNRYANARQTMAIFAVERGPVNAAGVLQPPTITQAISFGTRHIAGPERTGDFPGTANCPINLVGALIGVGEIDPATGVAYPACNGLGLANYQFQIPAARLGQVPAELFWRRNNLNLNGL